MTTIVEHLVQQLITAQVDTVFGLPGGENVHLLDALRRHNIRFVLVRNESSAVFMADAYAQLTGRIGVVLTTLGPGATNATVGLAHAYLDRAPVLLLTAETNQSYLPGHTHQVLDLQALFRPITKLSASLTPQNAANLIPHALHLLTDGRPGPVHLSLSRELSTQKIIPSEPPAPSPTHTPSADIAPIVPTLMQAKRPLILTGLGLEPEKPYAELLKFAEALQAPVIVTPKIKGAISDQHPLSAGTIGLTRTDPVYDLLAEADLIIAIGYDVVELVKPWKSDETAPLIWIASWPNDDPPLPAIAELTGPIAPILTELTTLTYNPTADWGAARIAQLKNTLAAKPLPMPRHGRILPQTILSTVREHTPADTLITTDVGSHKIFTALNWPAYKPNRYMVSNGLSAMGFGLSAAIAAAIVLQQPTVCITGDAGFGMVIGELTLIHEYNLPLTIVVMNDNALDLIRSAQRRANTEPFGTEFTNPNFKQIAAAYNLAYYQVTTAAQCATAVQNGVSLTRPTLIEALIDPVGYPTTV